MELWKIGVLGALVAGIVGYKVYDDQKPPPAPANPTPEPPSPLIGMKPPAWNIPSAADWVNTPKPITLASLAGSVAMVEIFRTECPHCADAAPMLGTLANHYKKAGVTFVGLQSPGQYNDPTNPENDWQKVKVWLKEKGVTYPVGFDRGSKYFQGGFPLEKKLYPCMFVLDKAGKVSFLQTGEDEAKMIKLVGAIEKQLGTGAGLEARLKAVAKILLTFPRFSSETEDSLVTALKAAVSEKA